MKFEDCFEIVGDYELKNGVYNVDGDVLLCSSKKVEKLPVKFGKVTGDFYCHINKLTSLEGCPTHIGGSLYCHYNNLISLKGCPKYVGGNFWCYENKLTSLEGSLTSIGGDFACYHNKLKSLECCPTYVGGAFRCDENLHNTKEYKQYLILRKLRK